MPPPFGREWTGGGGLRELGWMMTAIRSKIIGKVMALSICVGGLAACYASVSATPTEECRTVEVRNRHDVEVCTARCGDEGCRTHCSERERWSREHRCWVD
jgi:hypothetical protein